MTEESLRIVTTCPDGHETASEVMMDTVEKPVTILCAECHRRYSVWLKVESRPVAVTNSEPEWVKDILQ